MTSLIEEIRQKVADEKFEFSKHAVDQSILRQVQVQEIKEVIANGQVIEFGGVAQTKEKPWR